MKTFNLKHLCHSSGSMILMLRETKCEWNLSTFIYRKKNQISQEFRVFNGSHRNTNLINLNSLIINSNLKLYFKLRIISTLFAILVYLFNVQEHQPSYFTLWLNRWIARWKVTLFFKVFNLSLYSVFFYFSLFSSNCNFLPYSANSFRLARMTITELLWDHWTGEIHSRPNLLHFDNVAL